MKARVNDAIAPGGGSPSRRLGSLVRCVGSVCCLPRMEVQRVAMAYLHATVSWLTTQPFHIALFTGTHPPHDRISAFHLALTRPPVLGAVLALSAVRGVLGFLWRHIRPGVSFAKFGLKDGAYAGASRQRSAPPAHA